MKEKGIFKLFDTLKKVLSSIAISFSCIIILFLLSNTIMTQLNANNESYRPFISVYTIVSPSMTDTINVYDVVVNIRVKRAENIEIGDIITFKSKSSLSEGMTITHRVIGIDKETNGTIRFITQGDNNSEPDATLVEFEDIIGKEILIIPWLGNLQFLLSSYKGWIFLLLIPIAIILIKDIFKLIDLFGLNSRVNKVITEEIDKEKQRLEEERKQDLKEKLGIENPTNVEYNKLLTKKIEEYNQKIAELDKMIADMEKNSKPIKKYDGKDENYLKENKIKVVTEEVAKKKKPKKEELPILKENKKIIGIEKIDKKN